MNPAQRLGQLAHVLKKLGSSLTLTDLQRLDPKYQSVAGFISVIGRSPELVRLQLVIFGKRSELLQEELLEIFLRDFDEDTVYNILSASAMAPYTPKQVEGALFKAGIHVYQLTRGNIHKLRFTMNNKEQRPLGTTAERETLLIMDAIHLFIFNNRKLT